MRVGLGIISGLAFGGVTPRLNVRRAAPSAAPESGLAQRRELERLDTRLGDLRQALERLQRAAGSDPVLSASRVSQSEAVARSSQALDLEPYATFTTLGSTEAVNTIATSFTPRGPTVSGDSTSLATIGGVYDGDQGDDVLSFEFRDDATVGTSDRLRVRVRDGGGKTIANLNFRDVPAGTPLTLPNGLTLALGAGDVSRGDTFQVQVSTSIGSAVDPSQPFDGTRNDDPNFEPGLSVVAGSFDVNGVSIAVGASDSIDSVLARITASAAGVTASFDAATESVVLTQQQPGSAFDVVLDNDTSGFLAATKLDGAASVLGQDGLDPIVEPIGDVPALAGISSGTFSVNGIELSVDVDVDSLGDVLDRINAAGAGVTATLDPDTRILTVASDDPSATLVLADGTSGLFSALQIAPGNYGAGAASTRARFLQPDEVRPLLYDVGRELNRIFRPDPGSLTPIGELSRSRSSLRATILQSALGGSDADSVRLRSGLGIRLDLEKEDGRLLDFDARRLSRAVEENVVELHDSLFRVGGAENEPAGLVTGLIAMVDQLQDSLDSSLGRLDARGRLVDLVA